MTADALDLDRLEALKAAATPGPWVWDQDSDLVGLGDDYRPVVTAQGMHSEGFVIVSDADSQYIAAAVDALPALIAALREAEAKLTAIRGHIAYLDAEDADGESANIPDAYDPEYYQGMEAALRPIRAILDSTGEPPA
jgi:hypothetical protein